MSQTNFRAQDFKSSSQTLGSTKDDRPGSPETVAEPTSEPIVSSGASKNDVPEGTVPEVLSWVGDDQERAQRALNKENENDKPRKGLVSSLEDLLEEKNEDSSAAAE